MNAWWKVGGGVLAFVIVAGAAVFVMNRFIWRPLDLEEYETIKVWLVCSDCEGGERDAVRSIGGRAIPALASVLDTVPAYIMQPLRADLESGWDPDLHPDLESFVGPYLDNARATARIRSGLSLMDLGAEIELQVALDSALARGYRPEVIQSLRGALARVQAGDVVVASIRVEPESLSLAFGSTANLLAFIEDPYGNSVSAPVQWNSSDPDVASVDSAGAVTAIAEGSATITVSTGAFSDQASIIVTPMPPQGPSLNLVSGNRQTGVIGGVLASPVVVQVTDSTGAPVAGVIILWSVLQGGGSVDRPSAVTGGSGESEVIWTLGPVSGPQHLEARVQGGPGVIFRATALPGTPRSLSVLPDSLTLEMGQLHLLRPILTDGEGNEWTPSGVIWASADSTVAGVIPSGGVTGIGEGVTTVLATAGGISSVVKVVVIQGG